MQTITTAVHVLCEYLHIVEVKLTVQLKHQKNAHGLSKFEQVACPVQIDVLPLLSKVDSATEHRAKGLAAY